MRSYPKPADGPVGNAIREEYMMVLDVLTVEKGKGAGLANLRPVFRMRSASVQVPQGSAQLL